MWLRRVAWRTAAAVVLCVVAGWDTPAAAGTRRYVLNPGSSITSLCNSCGQSPAAPEALTGGFDVTSLPVGSAFDIAAVTAITLTSGSFAIGGHGFLQRIGPNRQAMVIDSTVNGEKVLFTSGRRQPADGESITIILSSPRAAEHTYVLVISATPVDEHVADADADAVADAEDNCPAVPNGDQADADGDRVGDACDQCAETSGTVLVNRDGCAIAQLCPCDATAAGQQWENQTAYLRCVARATRILRREGQMSRAESLALLRRAGRSLCGRTVVALR